MHVIRRHKVELEFEQSDVFFFPLKDSLLTESVVRNLFSNDPGVKRIDVFKFTG
jgi:hypothetical protein